MARRPGQAGADVPGGGITEESRHQGVDVMLAPQPVQDPSPAPSDAVQVTRRLAGLAEQRPVEVRPLVRRGCTQGFQVGKETDRRQGVVPQVRQGTAEPVGEGGTRHRVGGVTERLERDLVASGTHDEPCGPAPDLLVGVVEPGQRRRGGLGPGGCAPGR